VVLIPFLHFQSDANVPLRAQFAVRTECGKYSTL
jgi:hypothetical protein